MAPLPFLGAYAFSGWMHSAIKHLWSRYAVGAALCLATALLTGQEFFPVPQPCGVAPQSPKPAEATAASPSFLLSQWGEAGSEAAGKMKKEK